MEHTMKVKHSILTKLTVTGLISIAIALWTQWLSGDPAYPHFPPGPLLFIAVAGIVATGTRWWWTPLMGALIALFTTSGAFVRLPAEVLRLTHPGSVGNFAAGIFAGTLLQIASLLITDIAALAATVQNCRRVGKASDISKVACCFFGGLFVLMGILVVVGGARVDKYHNLMHLIWGGLAVAASFMGSKVSLRFCIGSGVFYLALALLGLLIGNPSMNRAWLIGPMLLHTEDHIFHLVLGTIFLSMGLLLKRTQNAGQVGYAPN
jgi:hypothetical protein